MARRVLVVGAQGFLGGFLARAFADEGWRVTRAGRRPESGADFRLVDLDRPETLRDAFGEVDLVVSTVRHPGLHAERAVLGQGPFLLNLDDLPATERAALKRQTPNPGGLVVDRCGLYGVAMLALVEILQEHPDADRVNYGFVVSTAEKSGRAGGALIHRLLSGRGRRSTESFRLVAPFGRCRTIETGPESESLLREIAGERDIRLYLCFMPAIVNRGMLALNALGLASRLPHAAFTAGRSRPPAEPSRQLTCHWVEVRRGGQVLASRIVSGEGDYRMSVSVTMIVADMLLSEAYSGPRRGLFGVDQILTLDDLTVALAKRGIAVRSMADQPSEENHLRADMRQTVAVGAVDMRAIGPSGRLEVK